MSAKSGMIPETNLCTGNLVDVLTGAVYLRDCMPDEFQLHLAERCGVCILTFRQKLVYDELVAGKLPFEVLSLKHEDMLTHWRFSRRQDLKFCRVCDRQFPEAEYLMCDQFDVCRFCSANRFAFVRSRR